MNLVFSWLLAKAKDYILTNWKTTLIGLVGSLLVKYIPDPEARNAALAGIVALLGLVAKDGDKTGTTALPRVEVPDPVVVDYVDYGSGG